MSRPSPHETAASEIMGTIVLIMIFVTMTAVVLAVVVNQVNPVKTPAFNVRISNESQVVRFYHAGGDSIPASELQVIIDGIVVPFSGQGSDGFLSIGETLTATSPNLPNVVQLVFTNPGAGQSVLAYEVLGTDQGGAVPTVTATTTPTLTPTPAPTVTTISPNTALQNVSVPVTVAGTGFQSGAIVTLVKAGQTDRVATSVNVVSPNLITCQFNLATAVVGPWDVNVTNTDGQSGTLAGGFTVRNPTPTITAALNPATGARGWMTGPITITGTNFKPGAIVALVNLTAGPDIVNTTPVINGPGTQIICTFDLYGQPAGVRNVTITNPYSDPGVRVNGFTITSNVPTITSSTPATGAQAATVSITNLAGTGFQPGATATYWRGTYSIPLTGVNVVSAGTINGTLVIPSYAPTGAYNITVTNTDGRSGTRTSGFTVTSNAPTVTSRNNATIYRGWMGYELIGGTNFVSGAQSVINTTTGLVIPSTACDVRSSTQMFCGYNLLGATASTTYRVAVINPDGKSGLLATATTVSSPRPTFASITPNIAARGTTVSITNLAGTYFQPGATVELRNATRIISTGSSVNVVSPTQITCQFTISSIGVRPGTNVYYVTVTNTDGQTRNSGNIFSIT